MKRKNDKKRRSKLFIEMIKEIKFAGFVSSEPTMKETNMDKRKNKPRPRPGIW
ncbi:hypothetical protein D3C73_1498630 [compost metagenome]